jgi:hypothetical protein
MSDIQRATAGTAGGPGIPPQKVPSAPKVFGVLSIVFASLTLISALASGCMQAASKGDRSMSAMVSLNSKDPAATAAAWEKYMSATRSAMVIQTVTLIVMSVALLILGIGQVRYSRWAGLGTIYWGIVGLISLVGIVLVGRMITHPAAREFFDVVSHNSRTSLEASLNNMMGSWLSGPWSMVLTGILYAPYPLLLLIFFGRREVREAMAR